MSDIELISPADIEKRSFQIIEETIKAQKISVPLSFAGQENRLYKEILFRCIHTTADFDYVSTLKVSDGALELIQKLIRDGADIVTDTNMALTGINKSRLEAFGGKAYCFMADEDVAAKARERGVTRAYAAMEKAYSLHKKYGDFGQTQVNPYKTWDNKENHQNKLCNPIIFVIGNAPTALISLHKLYKSEGFKPDFIVGVPVGFVNVVSAKELIMSTDIPYIVNEGNKGGSPVAAAIVNAVLKYLS